MMRSPKANGGCVRTRRAGLFDFWQAANVEPKNEMTEESFTESKLNDNNDENPLATIQAAAGQKRPQDGTGGPASKRAHIDNDEVIQVKVLIPAAAVGALIGKGGETMRNLKNESNCKVQMSKNQEVYHGTNERICLVKGKISQMMMVMEAISEKIREKVDPNASSDSFDHKGVPRTKEMKLLMPNTSAGMVIGKNGASIKEIRDATNCQIQVFPKAGTPEAKTSQERVVTVAHDDLQMLMQAVGKVLEKVALDPQHAALLDKESDFGSSNMFANNEPRFDPSKYGYGNGNGGSQWASGGTNNGSGSGGGSVSNSFRYNPMQGVGNNELLSFLDSLQSTLRTSGFNEASVAEVMQAMQVLAKYNIMGLGLGLGVAAMAQMRQGDSSSAYGGDSSFSVGGAEVRMGGVPPQSAPSSTPYGNQSAPPSHNSFYPQQQTAQPLNAQPSNYGTAGYGQVPAQYSNGGQPPMQSAPFTNYSSGPQGVMQYQGGQQGMGAQRVYITPR